MRRRIHYGTALPIAKPVKTRRLITFEQDHPVWAHRGEDGLWIKSVNGAIVRATPPYNATDAEIFGFRKLMQGLGAVTIRVLPRAPSPVLFGVDALSPALEVDPTIELKTDPVLPTVQAVIDHLIEHSFCSNKPGLQAIVDDCIGHAENRLTKKSDTAFDPGHIVGVRLENWLCFKGEQTIEDLQPIAYSVTAEDHEDPERSNYLGKSSFLRAIVFALTGDYPSDTADGWISHGENSGGVDLEFSSGLFVGRSKSRGIGTELEVVWRDETYTGVAAQTFLDSSVIDKERLFKTSYFEQKCTDQFIAMGPAERSATVNTWLGIDWVEDAAGWCLTKLNELCTRQATVDAKLISDDLEDELVKCRSGVGELKRTLAELKDQRVDNEIRFTAKTTWNSHAHRASTLESLKLKKIELGEAAVSLDPALLRNAEAGVKVAWAVEREAEHELNVCKTVAKGEFDGKCPVAKIKCPATSQINQLGSVSRIRLEEARKAKLDASQSHDMQDEILKDLQRQFREIEKAKGQLETLEQEIELAKESKKWLATHPEPPPYDSSVDERYEKAVHSLADCVSRETVLAKQVLEQVSLKAESEALRPQIELYRQAMLILGRSGVQRVIAEGALAQIEGVGNQALGQVGVGLQMRVSWSHETKQPAAFCDHCGSEFPKSTRVKTCTRCGAERGKKLSNELRISLNHRSGGADDLAGVMFKLAAARWLRSYEQSGWSVFLIDEPFGALDRAHVRSLSQHLSSLLGKQFGASQSFIVAHHVDVLEGTPGRIHLTSCEGVSTIALI